jgi:hypothetical protein
MNSLINNEVKRMGGYQSVDKSAERARIRSFLNQKESVTFSNIREKPLSSNGQNLKFDKNGKLVK